METIILHPQNVEQLSVFKQLFKTMSVPFETTNGGDLSVVSEKETYTSLTEDDYKMLHSRRENHLNNISKSYSWQEAKEQVIKRT